MVRIHVHNFVVNQVKIADKKRTIDINGLSVYPIPNDKCYKNTGIVENIVYIYAVSDKRKF